MAGGEFRLGTDSIYMALTCHIRCLTAIYTSHITWLRFPSQFPGTPSNSTPYRFSKKEVRSHCGHDAILQLLFGCDADMAQDGAGELGEETLDEVEPGAVLRREGEFEAAGGPLGEPGLGLLETC